MAVLARTVNDARDDILLRIGMKGDSNMQAVVIRKFNEALADLSGEHDWDYLRKNSTLTMSDATGVELLPDDCDRVLAIHERGANEILTQLDPVQFEQEQENTAITEPTFWIVKGYAQDTTSEAPRVQIEIHEAPVAATEFQIWYIKHVDAIAASSTATVPLPPFLWDLVQKRALIEVLKMVETLPSAINAEERRYQEMLMRAKQREKLGSTKYKAIEKRPDVRGHYATRFG